MSNIKIVKLDPTGFNVRPDTPTVSDNESAHSVDSIGGSETSSIASFNSEKTPDDLAYLPNVSSNVSVTKTDLVSHSSPVTTTSSIPLPPISNKSLNQSGGKSLEEPLVDGAQGYLTIKKNDDEISANSAYSQRELKTDELSTDSPASLMSLAKPIQPTEPEFSTMVKPPQTMPDQKSETGSRNDYYSTEDEEIIDMTDNKLYEVMASVLEDEEGDNVSENLAKISRGLEKLNDVLSKIHTEYAEINKERAKERRHFEQMAMAINNQNLLLVKIMEIFDTGKKNKPKDNDASSAVSEGYLSTILNTRGGKDERRESKKISEFSEKPKEKDPNIKEVRLKNRL